MKRFLPATALLYLAAMSAAFVGRARAGEPFVPGTGELLKDCCDDFEDPKWSYKLNLPKSSHEQDEQLERFGRERDLLPVAKELSSRRIERKGREFERPHVGPRRLIASPPLYAF